VNEGALLPTVTMRVSVQQSYKPGLQTHRSFGAAAIAQFSVPIYQGGRARHRSARSRRRVLNSVRQLSPRVLNLASVHYQQVRDSWFIRTPDGR
jgi:outer membrane protein TolC